MDIYIVKGTGSGPTKLAAFDAALRAAGIANFNLLKLSSIIPPNANIIVQETLPKNSLTAEWGDRLYVVMAQQRSDTPGEAAWAGVGWTTDAETGKGMFVEHEGTSQQAVGADIEATLADMKRTRGGRFGESKSMVAGITCDKNPVCALVCAVYKTEPW